MKTAPKPRKTANLSAPIHQQLSMYALAASAAGVGALCLAQPAEARIRYTPAHVAIKANGGLFRIDLNHDGIPDFGLSNSWYRGEKSYASLRVFQSQAANEIWVTNRMACGGIESVAAALPKGKRIGPRGKFKHYPYGAWMAARGGSGTCGVWFGGSNFQAYLGLKFTIQGEIHFGWARVRVDTQLIPFSATLSGYAYETIPGKPIIAGATKGPDEVTAQPKTAPVSLGGLALGRK